MKKLIQKNPNKAQKISLLVFVSLMVLSGFLGVILDSLLTWFFLVVIALWQIVAITKYATYCQHVQQQEKANELLERMKGISYAVSRKSEVSVNEQKDTE